MRMAVNASEPKAETFRALQLVCKSWREAFLEYSSCMDTAGVRLFDATDLYGACKLLPRLSKLRARRTIGPQSIYLHPLSACCYLTSLSLNLEGAEYGMPFLDMLALPNGLKNLWMEKFEADSGCYRYIKATCLTSLTFLPYKTLGECNTFELLQYLPELQVSLLRCPTTVNASVNGKYVFQP